ncbi:apolipoprotein D and lipocalin family protein [Variovorax sp. SG517]|uniref:lipocalin family protein n=1 Tax=Variovorax sp. SG517 TaxID=2587117 RepID=UPI0017E9BF5C|nr:lipocalin family protein [Variovorax sp. SG517]NVM92777.1 apolipoprotein D and lipocalin family protein [Variovorax sp. SG517]
MTPRPRTGATSVQPFDDRRTGNAIGAMATAFVVGGVAAWFTMGAARSAARSRLARPAGPADGAPLMRAPLQVVAPVDLERYAGLWHEQARLPNRFQKQCAGPVTAEYTLQSDGTVQVRNRCVREDGNFDEAVGTARVVPVAGQPGAGRLEVRFAPAWLGWLPMVWGDYWILKLDRDYQVSLVGTPDREYLWVLSRAPRLEDAVLQAELDYARSLGFDTGKVILTGR